MTSDATFFDWMRAIFGIAPKKQSFAEERAQFQELKAQANQRALEYLATPRFEHRHDFIRRLYKPVVLFYSMHRDAFMPIDVYFPNKRESLDYTKMDMKATPDQMRENAKAYHKEVLEMISYMQIREP